MLSSSLSCRDAQRHLSLRHDHEPMSPMPAPLAAHLADCPHCRRFAEALNEALPAPAAPTEPGRLARRALAAWDTERGTPKPHVGSPWFVTGVAGCVASVVAAGVWYSQQSPLPLSTSSTPVVAVATPTPLPTSVPPVAPPAPDGKPTTVAVALSTPASAPLLAPYTAPVVAPVPSRRPLTPTRRPKAPSAIPASSVDDLAFINADPSAALNGWANLSRDDQAQLERQIRASLKRGDDFVRVPFPRLAALDDRRAVTTALRNFRREASIVDPRLQRQMSLSVKQESFSTFCEKLTAQTGIAFAADDTVKDDNLILFCTARSLRDVLRQISRHFGYTWQREGEAGQYRYTLTQGLAAQIAEEELRNRDRADAILDIDRDMQKYRPYLHLSSDDVFEQRVRDYKAYLAAGEQVSKAPAKEQARLARSGAVKKLAAPMLDSGRERIFDTLFGTGWAPIQLYFRLTGEQQIALRRGEELRFSTLPQVGEFPLPNGMEAKLRASLRTGFVITDATGSVVGYQGSGDPGLDNIVTSVVNQPPGEQHPITAWVGQRSVWGVGKNAVSVVDAPPGSTAVQAVLQLKEREPGVWDLYGGSGFGIVRDGKIVQGGANLSGIAEGRSPSVRALQGMPSKELPAATRPALRRPVNAFKATQTSTFRQLPLRIEITGELANWSQPRISASDVWERLHRATGQDILSDGYTRLLWPEKVPAVQGKPLADALNRICPALGQRWRVATGEGGGTWVLARSATFFNDRLVEVPRRLWEAWAEKRRERGYLPLQQILEMSALSDAQLDSNAAREAAIALYGLREWEMAASRNFRKDWRFLHTLTEAQRAKLLTRDGLPFRELSEGQKDAFLRPRYPSGLNPQSREDYETNGAFRIRYVALPDAQKEKRRTKGEWSSPRYWDEVKDEAHITLTLQTEQGRRTHSGDFAQTP